MTQKNLTVSALAGLCLATTGALAGTTAAKAPAMAETPAKEPSIYDQIWGLTKLYSNKDNPFIQELSLAGRYHGQ